MQSIHKNETPQVNILTFVEKAPAELQIRLLAGADGLEKREITSARIQKLGLALAGFADYIHCGRVQIVGQSEISYLAQLDLEKRRQAINNLDLNNICCVLITKSLNPPAELIEIADQMQLPIVQTSQASSVAIGTVSRFLQELLAPQMTLHGVLLGVYGLGVLLFGESGIGKSECALDLITRGHQLISDDAVLIKRIGDELEGASPDLTYELLEIRGLGIINIKELFGVSAIGIKTNIDLCVELKKWDEPDEIERLGIESMEEDIFGVKITKFVLPVSLGRNTATLVETAIRLHLLRISGYDATQQLIDKHTKMLMAVTEN